MAWEEAMPEPRQTLILQKGQCHAIHLQLVSTGPQAAILGCYGFNGSAHGPPAPFPHLFTSGDLLLPRIRRSANVHIRREQLSLCTVGNLWCVNLNSTQTYNTSI